MEQSKQYDARKKNFTVSPHSDPPLHSPYTSFVIIHHVQIMITLLWAERICSPDCFEEDQALVFALFQSGNQCGTSWARRGGVDTVWIGCVACHTVIVWVPPFVFSRASNL